MNPPLIFIAHYDPRELVFCPDCGRISNSVTQCNACAASCGLVGLSELMNPKAAETNTHVPAAATPQIASR